MNSWRRSACYPRGSFYPLSDGPSMRNHRITKPWFPTCSSCFSCSQALLYLCIRRVISIHAERTFGCLRYLLGGDRPSRTARLTMSSTRINGFELELQQHQAGISTATPRELALPLPSLPAILHRSSQNSLSKYSKAPRGLSVLPRVDGIFTTTAISPSPSPRQRSTRYAIRAGRNLPDKEFRYLRTVIVTAAVYWGFSSKLRVLLP